MGIFVHNLESQEKWEFDFSDSKDFIPLLKIYLPYCGNQLQFNKKYKSENSNYFHKNRTILSTNSAFANYQQLSVALVNVKLVILSFENSDNPFNVQIGNRSI